MTPTSRPICSWKQHPALEPSKADLLPCVSNTKHCAGEICISSPGPGRSDSSTWLQPGERSTNVCITLQTVPFQNGLDVQYEALSYAWGSLEEVATVFVNENVCVKSLTVTKHVEEALLFVAQMKHECYGR